MAKTFSKKSFQTLLDRMGGGALSISGGLLIFSNFSQLATHNYNLEPWLTSAIILSLYYSIVSNIII